MKIFKLPDLGEGLPDAIIREWYVKEGEEVALDQALASMETAKALVDVPSPFAGKIEKLFGQAGDTIETGKPLVGFEGQGEAEEKTADKGTVVGALEVGKTVLKESASGVDAPMDAKDRIKATPVVRALARKLGVDLSQITTQGERITAEDVQAAAQRASSKTIKSEAGQKLSPVRRAMVMSMTQSHREIVPVSIMDDADINDWDAQQEPTLRLIRAIVKACEIMPIMNAYFDSQNLTYQINKSLNLGIAVDSPEGLFVPVIKDAGNLDAAALRNKINQFKTQAQNKTIPAEDLHGATIMLSNFGVIAGRYANPIIIPPMVCIVGVGRSRDAIIAVNKKPEVHRIMPLSVTIDHRIVTGGEAARFLKELMQDLSQPN